MTKKHFIAIAAIFKQQVEQLAVAHAKASKVGEGWSVEVANEAVRKLAQDFARLAANDNPKFDAQRFLRACGINNIRVADLLELLKQI